MVNLGQAFREMERRAVQWYLGVIKGFLLRANMSCFPSLSFEDNMKQANMRERSLSQVSSTSEHCDQQTYNVMATSIIDITKMGYYSIVRFILVFK